MAGVMGAGSPGNTQAKSPAGLAGRGWGWDGILALLPAELSGVMLLDMRSIVHLVHACHVLQGKLYCICQHFYRQLVKLESWKRAERRQIRAELRQLAKEERQRQQKAVQVCTENVISYGRGDQMNSLDSRQGVCCTCAAPRDVDTSNMCRCCRRCCCCCCCCWCRWCRCCCCRRS